MDLHGGTPYAQALSLPMSLVRVYFESSAWKLQGQSREAQAKLDAAVIGRLDNVVKAIGHLGKAIVAMTRR